MKTRSLMRRGSGEPLTDLDSLFDDFFSGFGLVPLRSLSENAPAAFRPSINVSESEKEYKVSAELPGLDEKDVKVEMEENVLMIHGEKKEEKKEENEHWHHYEHSYGSFQRVIPFQHKVDEGKVKADFKKGILTVTLPKLKDDKGSRKSIKIQAA